MGAFISQGDTQPALTAVLEQPEGCPLDLDGREVFLYAHHVGGLASITGECETGADGRVTYQWSEGDTDVPGLYHAEFVVDGAQTVPNDAPFSILIRPRLG